MAALVGKRCTREQRGERMEKLTVALTKKFLGGNTALMVDWSTEVVELELFEIYYTCVTVSNHIFYSWLVVLC